MLLAIDPGNEQSAWVLYDPATGTPCEWAKEHNEAVLNTALSCFDVDVLAIEMIASYGMPVGAEVFETCVWIGRFLERWQLDVGGESLRVYRRDVKLHLCGSARAKDPNVRQALIDRFGPGRERAIGTKKAPGPCYGIAADGWAALGVAVTVHDTVLGRGERAA